MADNSARYDRDGSRRENVSGVKFDVWLQGGLDNCCSLYAVLNAFSYLFARDDAPDPKRKGYESGLLRREEWQNWNAIKEYSVITKNVKAMYLSGVYPIYVERLAKRVNKTLFHEKYCVKRVGKIIETQVSNPTLLLHIVFVHEDEEDKLGHWIVLINPATQTRSKYKRVIDSNRRYDRWRLDGRSSQLLVRRDREPEEIAIHKIEAVVSIYNSSPTVDA